MCDLAEDCEDCPLYVDKDTEYEAHKVLLPLLLRGKTMKIEKELTTYQIYLILLGYLAEHNDTEMLKPMLTELYRRAESEEENKQKKYSSIKDIGLCSCIC